MHGASRQNKGEHEGVSSEEAHIGFDEIDTDKDRAIEFEEFVQWWSER